MKKTFPLFFFFLLSIAVFAQAPGRTNWSYSPYEFKVFIENKGQFDGKNDRSRTQVYYGVDNMGFQIYYNASGLTYRMDQWGITEKDYKRFMEMESGDEEGEKEDKEEMDEIRRSKLLKSAIVHVEWLGSNPNVKIVPSGLSQEYFNYGGGTPEKSINNAKAYTKLTYVDLYPGIDLEYTFHEKEGTKYALIVHPGADASKIKMKYSGMDNLSIDKQGNIRLQTCMGEIVDHAPLTFLEGGKEMESSFNVDRNIISFKLPLTINHHTSSIVIDPWTTNPLFTATNKGLDVESDAAGNCYVYGAQNPFKLRKYNSAGTPQWTYNATALFNTTWFGYLATDFAGNSYISNGFANGMVEKISPAGALIVGNYNIGTGFAGSIEIFNLCFNQTQTQLVAGNSPGGHAVGNLNQGACTMTGITNVGGTASEIRGMCNSSNGNFYGLTVSNGVASKVICFSPALVNVWSVPSGYTAASFGYYAPAYTGWFVFGSTINPNSQHDIVATKCYVYTYNGDTIRKRSTTNGALVAQVKVPGGTAGGNSGIIADSCENIYVGTANGISKFDQNLNFLTSAATAGAVYDIVFGPNKEIYAVGNALVCSVGGMVLACAQANLTINTTSSNASCGGFNGSASVTSVSGGINPYTYTWSNGATGNSATGLSAGTYTVTVKDNSCVQMVKTVTVQVGTSSGGTASITANTNVTCNGGNNGTATATMTGGTGTLTYSWNPTGQVTSNATGLSAGTYTVTVTDANGCSSTATVSITQPTAITASTINIVNATCSTLGTATASGTGGTGSYTYSWSIGTQTGQTATGLTAGTYTVKITDANGCTKTASATITGTPGPTASISNSVNATCANGGSATASGAGGFGSYTYSWNTSGQTTQTATGLAAGTYTVTITDANGCTSTATVAITLPSGVTASISNKVSATCVNLGTATASGTGGTGSYTYSWSSGAQTTQTATGLGAGTYTVTITDGNGCTSTATVAITVPSAINASISNSINSTCTTLGSATASGSNGTGSYTYSWSSGAQTTQTATGLAVGTYTVLVTDANGCTATATVAINGTSNPTANAGAVNVLCNGGNTGTAGVTAAGGFGTYTYSWNNTQNTQVATGLTAGTYTVLVSDANGCTATATVTVTEPTALTVNVTGGTSCSGALNGIVSATGGGGTPNYNYAWSNGQNTQSATGLSPGTYTVTVTDANGCTATTTAQVTANVAPTVTFTADDTSGCVPLCVNFTCTSVGINAWTWNFGDGSSNGTGALINHCYKTAGSFNVTLTITDLNGCTATLTKNAYINVFPNVVAAFTASPQPTTILSPTITFTDLSTGGASVWSWTFGDLLNSTSSVQNPTFNYKDSGCYNVQLIADNQYNCPDTADQVVCILGDYELFAPNAFTPDGNGLNDVWNVKGIGIDPNHFELWIFDRWGDLIFQTTDLFQGWNGKANGGKEIAQQDVYVWKVAARDFLGAKHSYIGHINLVR